MVIFYGFGPIIKADVAIGVDLAYEQKIRYLFDAAIIMQVAAPNQAHNVRSFATVRPD